MKPINKNWKRPATAAETAEMTQDAESFGRNVRDWQHALRNISSRREFVNRIQAAPKLLAKLLGDQGQSDAYLAAYVEWLCNKHSIEAPTWVHQPKRISRKAWFDYPPLWQDSFVHAPASFRRRGVFTRPEDVLKFRKGRPKVSNEQKRLKSIERQRRYRARIRELVKAGRTLSNESKREGHA
jgi:hypothetical protein